MVIDSLRDQQILWRWVACIGCVASAKRLKATSASCRPWHRFSADDLLTDGCLHAGQDVLEVTFVRAVCIGQQRGLVMVMVRRFLAWSSRVDGREVVLQG